MCLGLAAGYIKPKENEKQIDTKTIEQTYNNFVLNLAENAYINMCTTQEMNIAINALKKQIPEKPISFEATSEIKIGAGTWGVGTTIYKCPCCDSFITRSSNFCSKCGKAIDWRCENVQTD